MSGNRIVYVLIGLALTVLASFTFLEGRSVALGESPAGPTTAFKSVFPVTDAPQGFQLIEQVVDFAPGAWTGPHSHGGHVFVTVAQGTVAQFSEGKDTLYRKGETWQETPGHVHQAGNPTSAPSRDVATFLLAPGAQQTTPQQVANAHDATIKPVSRLVKFEVPAVARPFDLVEMELDFAPGQQQASHTYGGPAFVLVLDGELTLRANGTEKSVKAGEGWTETAGQFSEVVNAGSAPASAFVTVLPPKGATLMTVQGQPATLPTTGGELGVVPFGLVLISALLIIGGGWLWLRNARRAR